jgi:predicted 3-demethylubiquinone-9 3-methyltransferase (glyoxalase superfamily)
MQKIATFLMFEGQAEEAMSFYLSLFPDSKLESIARYGEGEAGRAGSVQHATFSLNDQLFMCIDSPVKHQFTFTPSMSLHVTCSTEQEINQLFASLSVGGQILMPLDSYPFAKKYTWLNDRFGVSWQLALVEA